MIEMTRDGFVFLAMGFKDIPKWNYLYKSVTYNGD